MAKLKFCKYPKYVKPTTEGKCPYCHKHVQSLENHIHDKHKGEKRVINQIHQ